MKFTKPLCSQCTLDGDCHCQKECQTSVNHCGMDEVLEYNDQLNSKHSQTYSNPKYAEFMHESEEPTP